MTDEELLEENGWTPECWSPFEIRHEDGSFATGQAARTILAHLRSDQLCEEVYLSSHEAQYYYQPD